MVRLFEWTAASGSRCARVVKTTAAIVRRNKEPIRKQLQWASPISANTWPESGALATGFSVVILAQFFFSKTFTHVSLLSGKRGPTCAWFQCTKRRVGVLPCLFEHWCLSVTVYQADSFVAGMPFDPSWCRSGGNNNFQWCLVGRWHSVLDLPLSLCVLLSIPPLSLSLSLSVSLFSLCGNSAFEFPLIALILNRILKPLALDLHPALIVARILSRRPFDVKRVLIGELKLLCCACNGGFYWQQLLISALKTQHRPTWRTLCKRSLGDKSQSGKKGLTILCPECPRVVVLRGKTPAVWMVWCGIMEAVLILVALESETWRLIFTAPARVMKPGLLRDVMSTPRSNNLSK